MTKSLNCSVLIDSLENALTLEKNPIKKVELLYKLGKEKQYNEFKASYDYGQKAYLLAQKIKYERGKALGLLLMGNGLNNLGKHVASAETLSNALKIAQSIKDYALVSEVLKGLFYVHYYTKDLKLAQKCAEDKIQNDKLYDSSIENKAVNADLMGLVYEEQGKLDEAFDYYKQARNYALITNDSVYLTAYTNNMAIIYSKSGKYDSALVYHRKAFQYLKPRKTYDIAGFVTLWIAKSFFEKGEIDSAFYNAKLGLKYSSDGAPQNSFQLAYEILYKVFKHKQKYDSSLYYFEKYNAITDSLENAEKLRAISGVENRYQLEQKNIELQFKEKEIQRKNQLILISIFISFLIGIIAFVLYNRNLVKKRLNSILESQKLELFEQNQEIEAQNEEISAMNKNLEDVVDTRTRQLLESEKLLTMSQQLAKLGSWILDLETQNFKWSKQVYEILDVSDEEDINLNLLEVRIGENNFRELLDRIDTSASKNEPMEYEFELESTAGGKKHLYFLAIPEFDPTINKVKFLKGCVQDITERKIAELKLIEQTNLLIETNKKAAEYKLMALRSVMNPHFLFNSLNSIQYFIAKNIKEQAIDYLSQFSKLMRLILNSSVQNTITLAQEIEMLRFYVNLEALRFNKFKSNFSIQAGLDIEYIEVPSLLLQPFVENAILHGLSHLSHNEGLLEISFSKIDNKLICTIEDNGIGRAAANSLKKGENKLHKSVGMNITSERIQMVNDSEFLAINIIDKTDLKGNALGTKVEVVLEID